MVSGHAFLAQDVYTPYTHKTVSRRTLRAKPLISCRICPPCFSRMEGCLMHSSVRGRGYESLLQAASNVSDAWQKGCGMAVDHVTISSSGAHQPNN